MKGKLIEWAIFATVAVGTVFIARWSVPHVIEIAIETGLVKPTPRRVNPALRRRLRQQEDRLAQSAPAALRGQAGSAPCLVLPVHEGVGGNSHPGASASPAGGLKPSVGPFRPCLNLVPGGPPANGAELTLQNGTFLFVQTDLYLPGNPPIAFTHAVLPHRFWSWQTRNQIYLPSEYLTFNSGHRNPYSDQTLWLLDGRTFFFKRISKGTGYADAVYKHTGTHSLFYNALAGWNGNGWDYDLPDGRTLVFPDAYHAKRTQQQEMVGLIEPSGASLTLKRDRQGFLHEVRASDGRWMKLHYRGPFVVSIEDSAGGKATYTYNKQDRLSVSTNAAGEALRYHYNSSGDLTTVENVKTKQKVFSVGRASNDLSVFMQADGGPVFRFTPEKAVNPNRSRQRMLKLVVTDNHGHQWVLNCGNSAGKGCQLVESTR